MSTDTLRGRPRSESSRAAIIEATIQLVEKVGYEKLSIVEVAKTAGVGKQTIYRWWKSKAELVIEAVLEDAQKHVLVPDTGTLEGDLRELLRRSCHRLKSDASRSMLSGLMMAGRKDKETLRLFREQFIEIRRDVIRKIFQRHRGARGLRKDLNTELIIDLIFGPMWYRLLVEIAPLDETFADQLVDQIMLLCIEH